MAAPSADRINARAAKDKAFLKRALKNPGLRAKLDPRFLSKPQAAARALNVRLNAPIAPGSSTTERDLAHEAQAATTVRYGPQDRDLAQQLGVAQQTQTDTGAFYDQYRQALQQHAQNVQMYQAGAQQALAQTQAGVTGLGQAQAAQLQQQADAGAAQQGVAQAGQIGDLANQALAVRQAQMGSYGAQQAAQGAAMNAYADTQANVVAPGQKLSALAQARGRTQDVRKKASDLATEKGAFNETFRDTRRQDEFKNQLAASTLNVNAANVASDAAAAGARTTETTRHNRTQESIAKTRNKTAAKTAQQKADLAAGKVNQYGYTDAAWRAMNTSQRQKVIKDFKAKTKTPAGAGPDWQTTQRQSAARSQVSSLKRYAAMAKAGKAFVAGHSAQKPANRHEAAVKIQQAVAAPDDPILVTAALDAVYDGRLSRATVRKLIAAGYKPSQIMSALGVGSGPTPRPGQGNPNIPSGKV